MEIDTANKFLVSVANDGLMMLRSPRVGELISVDDALVLAAYLVTLADPSQEKFKKVLEAVENA